MFTLPNVSHVMCHVSHVTCHVSHVTCQVSQLFFLFFFLIFFLFRTKWWSLSVEGLSSTGLPSLVYIGMTKWLALVLKDDSMVWHHMGPSRMHPDRSSCLGLSANGWLSQDQLFCTFSETMLRSVYRTVHALGLVLLNTHYGCLLWENWIFLRKYAW